jgi:peptidoglycan/LPS O-acetylase OafA/YrhL
MVLRVMPAGEHTGSRPQPRFVVLDGLRGLAAIVIVVDHVPNETLSFLLPHRTMAVDFFFVLSGFVLTHAYGSRLSDEGGARLGALTFLRIRLARFWPMMVAALALVTSLYLIKEVGSNIATPAYKWIGSLAFGLTFLPTPVPLAVYPNPFPLIVAEHTMFFELVANLVFALLAARLTQSILAGWLIGSGGLLIWAGTHYGTLDLGFDWLGFEGGFPRVLYSFFAGVAIYRIWSRSPSAPALPSWVALVLLLLVFAMPARGQLFAPFEIVTALLIFPALVFFAAGAPARGLAARIFLYAGALSYGFYLLHGSVAFVLTAVVRRLQIDPMSLDVWMVVLVVLGTGGLTAILHYYYERPFRRWLFTRMVDQRVALPAA